MSLIFYLVGYALCWRNKPHESQVMRTMILCPRQRLWIEYIGDSTFLSIISQNLQRFHDRSRVLKLKFAGKLLTFITMNKFVIPKFNAFPDLSFS